MALYDIISASYLQEMVRRCELDLSGLG